MEIQFLNFFQYGDVKARITRFSDEFLFDAYCRWFKSYRRRAGIYYRTQLQHTIQYEATVFCRSRDLNTEYELYEYFGEYPDLQNEWVDYQHDKGLIALIDRVTSEMHQLEEHHQLLGLEDGLYVSDLEAFEEYIRSLTDGVPRPESLVDTLDALWFNWHIDNTPETAAQLRSLPYTEYLKTDHWKQVRAAMLVAYGAHCQGKGCYQGGMDSYWFDTKHLHVHHLNYKHKGNERFTDLMLLCDNCHKLLHAGQDMLPDRMFSLVLDESQLR